jgi:hypothetical protein
MELPTRHEPSRTSTAPPDPLHDLQTPPPQGFHYSLYKIERPIEERFEIQYCAQLYDMLNQSHQLLNIVYSSVEFAAEAADVFYRQSIFEFNNLYLPCFI